MKKITPVIIMASLLFLMPQRGQAQETRTQRPRAPQMTSDDISPRGGMGGSFESESNITPNAKSGTSISNPRGVLQTALTRMASARTLKTRMQLSAAEGTREITIENVKPDRMRLVAPDGEIVVIGNSYYYKPAGGSWQVSTSKDALAASTSMLDYRAFLEQGLKQPGVTITGKVLGDEVIDGIETTAYELAIADNQDSGTVQLWVEKNDGYIRRMFLTSSAISMRIWCSGINENFSIQKPQM